MGEIITAFGIDWRLITIQIFNFGLLIGLLWYFLYTPVLRIIDERRMKIEEGVKDSEKASQLLSEAHEEKKLIEAKAHGEAEAIVARGKEAADHVALQTKEAAQRERERILEEVALRAKTDAEKMEKDAEKAIAQAAILAAQKILREKTQS